MSGGGRTYPLYCYNGEWSRICAHEETWGAGSARVACRQLGYSGVSKLDSQAQT